MVFFYWVLLFLYMILLVMYYFTERIATPHIRPWPILTHTHLGSSIVKPLPCSHHSDCPETHACLATMCIPKFLRGNRCDHGEWQSYHYMGGTFALCVCTQPHLFNSKHFGGDCDVSVACGRHGTFEHTTGTCICDRGYKEGPQWTCQKVPVSHIVECDPHELPIDQVEGYHPDYLAKLRRLSIRCVPKPCTVDPLSGNVLHHALYSPHRGCVCDPRYGLLGVHLKESTTPYLYSSSHGLDACINIFKNEPMIPYEHVELYQYFYIGKMKPITIAVYQHLETHDIIPELQEHIQEDGAKVFMIQQPWPSNYVQHILQNGDFIIRKFHYRLYHFGGSEKITTEEHHEKYYPCRVITNFRRKYYIPDHVLYTVDWRFYEFYRFLVCQIPSNDDYAETLFWNSIVLNPLHVRGTTAMVDQWGRTDELKLKRTNGLKLTYESMRDKWILELAEDYNISFYLENNEQTNAPGYDINTEIEM